MRLGAGADWGGGMLRGGRPGGVHLGFHLGLSCVKLCCEVLKLLPRVVCCGGDGFKVFKGLFVHLGHVPVPVSPERSRACQRLVRDLSMAGGTVGCGDRAG
jgi:hypothetical protein